MKITYDRKNLSDDCWIVRDIDVIIGVGISKSSAMTDADRNEELDDNFSGLFIEHISNYQY